MVDIYSFVSIPNYVVIFMIKSCMWLIVDSCINFLHVYNI